MSEPNFDIPTILVSYRQPLAAVLNDEYEGEVKAKLALASGG